MQITKTAITQTAPATQESTDFSMNSMTYEIAN